MAAAASARIGEGVHDESNTMHVLMLIVVLFALTLGPGLWVKSVMRKYASPADRYAFTGSELARRLLDELDMRHVPVEQTQPGADHYDPTQRVVRLSPEHYDGRSLTAVTVAAHEVGHAIQHEQRFGPLSWRTALVRLVKPLEQVGAGILIMSPVIAAVTRAPQLMGLSVMAGMGTILLGVAVHGVTLPTEFDASFGRALPLLERKRILHQGDAPHARRILMAAALTYVSQALMSLLNVARWFTVLRRGL
jgi:Zn-dependent membrane protease YugP